MNALQLTAVLLLTIVLVNFALAATGIIFSGWLVIMLSAAVLAVAQAYTGAQVFVHARSRGGLYAGIPAWIWGLWAAFLPVIGLLLF